MKRKPLELIPTEDEVQASFFKWCLLNLKPPVMAFHIPNGLGKLGHASRAKSIRLGVRAGVADVCVIWSRVGFIEFKRDDGRADTTALQDAFRDAVVALGHPYGVARSLDEAIALLRAWGCPIGGAA